MKTTLVCAVSAPSPERAIHRVAVVGPRRELDGVPLPAAPWPGVLVDRVADEAFADYLDGLGGETLAVVLVVAEAGDRGPLRILRSRPERLRTRAYLLARAPARLLAPVEDDSDVEGIVDLDRLTPEALARAVENGLRAYGALGTNPLIPEYYLDATYNRIFDWFETTKWDWRELDLSQIRRELLTEPEIDILQESAIIEFGTLPGAHNFLREWADEYSFSSWALSWGAE
ncbi:MAG TPA: ferritin-like domain-containing protein, partial [Candidatus Polarisedimenticolia bacterium]|nr:ferritin-like domain-containing protein [Candidatus Polarisedimenticolia bacterium]